ncbi:phage holin family protein [Microbaculum marinum]|uniref:Phage holin family protein n=1 Tax=Microbaculum marinum TaxID=1764581 RepID=A0AAW9RCV1_9HYPH
MTIQGNIPRDPAEPKPALNALLGEALRNGADLINTEMALLRAELASNIRQVALGLALFLFSAVFVIIALGLAIDALVVWLTPVLGSPANAAIACAAGAALIALLLFFVGYRKVRVDTLYPERTASSIRSDAQMLKRKVTS